MESSQENIHSALIPHLFRTEFGKITAVLTRMLGVEHMSTSEDIAGETFLAALESWPYNGIPKNPAAWLYTVAKNKTKNHLQRSKTFNEKIARQLNADLQISIDPFSDEQIIDSQLQMLFAVANPVIPVESQVALALRVLCGFGIDEIASAFLSNKETINKRLLRAKEKLRTHAVVLEMPGADNIEHRLSSVLTTLYLLFNEGYYSESNQQIIRKELCADAMRLTLMLINYPPADLPATNALMALMCFHASRLDARMNERQEILLYEEQDESLWNQELVLQGAYYFHRSTNSNQLSRYHLEAGIAYWHTKKEDSPEKWENILQLYNRLLMMEYSPVAALNRTWALSKLNGPGIAIKEAEKLSLDSNRFYHVLLGYLYRNVEIEKSKQHFIRAIALTEITSERQTLLKELQHLNE